ncbi:transcription-repair coupling factor [Treponema sp. OMZ 840]|uniref:transcription-repair coupling factor n=1 Tax=Treponema sp. OMZ 840 TaxID=244313 RepID=UPI003D8D3A70
MNSLYHIIHSSKNIQGIIQNFQKEDVYPCQIEGAQKGLYAFFLAEFLNADRIKPHNAADAFTGVQTVFLIVPEEKEAKDLLTDLQSVFSDKDGNALADIYSLPWWGTLPYRAVAKGARVFGERASVLAKMLMAKRESGQSSVRPSIFVMTQRAFLTPVPPAAYTESLIFSLSAGQSFDPAALADRLSAQGYIRVPRVTVRGEFTMRGEVFDIFMPGEDYPHRIVFDFDRIESIRSFDRETQTSIEKLTSLIIYPMKETVWTDNLIQRLDTKLSRLAGKTGLSYDTVLESLINTREADGEELFYPIVHAEPDAQSAGVKSSSVLDYASTDTAVFFFDYDRQLNAVENLAKEYSGLYKKACSFYPERFIPPPETQILDFESSLESHKKRLLFRTIHTEHADEKIPLKIECDPPRSFFGNINYLKESLEALQKDGWRIFIYADSSPQAMRIGELLKDFPGVIIVPLQISSGFALADVKTAVIQENEIFGRRKHTPKSIKQAKSAVLDTFVELNPGDFVVHVNYGIGLFKGIERVKALGHERDYVKLEYADEETVFIPIEQVNLVQRYIGNEGDAPRLDRLGSKNWENRKNRVKQSVEDIAEKLIDLYSRRKAARGFAFPKDSEFMTAFEAAFPYVETEDQLTVAEEIKADMEKPVPMDRLICGDVGYGKTELAMRAAFKAVMGGKQVAFLAPTTILAEQHYETCAERFENFPVRIAHMSRFVSKAEQTKILKSLAAGEIDILIGTHRIIQKDVRFKDLGLMIIDEEQRFGVKDKERLKQLKTNIDALAMSATPIPRTLHMSLLKIRDMSLLKTPPQNRQAIETVIDAYNEERVAEAIRREAERGGQVFYLHNRVESLEEVRIKLQQAVPEMLIDTAHGRMSAGELDDIFRRFKMGGFHVLIATTIIENGIDIPNVNTIIIDRADMYGVSQLYQLRGRVGRSDRKAYAYLLYPENRALSEVAMKRLQVISDFTELGSGFKIAMKDMEIRGAGNLLGRDQSGDVYSVGFDLYLRLLEEAVRRLSDENYTEEEDVLLELEYTGFIPDSYISNAQIKMEVYKKIAAASSSATSEDEAALIYAELEDRFGPVPPEVSSLLALAEIKIMCRKLSISSLKERNGSAAIEFSRVSDISVEKVLRLIKESAGRVKLDARKPNVLILQTGKIGLQEKSEFIKEKLEALMA